MKRKGFRPRQNQASDGHSLSQPLSIEFPKRLVSQMGMLMPKVTVGSEDLLMEHLEGILVHSSQVKEWTQRDPVPSQLLGKARQQYANLRR